MLEQKQIMKRCERMFIEEYERWLYETLYRERSIISTEREKEKIVDAVISKFKELKHKHHIRY